METIKKLVKNKQYNRLMSILIVFSMMYIIGEKIFYFDRLSSAILEKIDICILAIFAVDFLLRFIAGKFEYFLKEYGWIDFLATIPILSPAIKSFGFFRTFRTSRMLRFIRILRVMRIMKAVKNNTSSIAKENHNFYLPLSSILMILMIIFGTALIFNYTEVSSGLEEQRETTLLLKAAGLDTTEEKATFLLNSNKVIEVLDVAELDNLLTYTKKGYKQEDIHISRFENSYVVFSRKETNKKISFFEGILYISLFSTTILFLLIITFVMEVKLKFRVRKLGALMNEKTNKQDKPRKTTEELNKLEELVKRYNKLLR